MFDKFEAFMNKYMTPLANKMDKEVHLSAVKKSMVALTPLLIIGSFCLIPEAIPNMIGEDHAISVWIMANLDTIYIPFNVGMALMSVYVTAIISYHLANSYKLDVPGSISMGLVAFLMMTYETKEGGGLSTTFFGPKGLFAAIFGALVAVELYRWCKKKNFTIKMPESVPDFVSRSFEMIPISVIVIGFFLVVRIICVNVLHTMPPLIFTNIFAPLVGSMDNIVAVWFVNVLSCLLFFFGIHPSVMSPITSPISTQFLADNMAAYQAHTALPHFYTGGAISAFCNFTGTGVTFGCVFWCLMSKNKALKQVGRVALIPALFGINEPILFGAPIVLNPLFFIPYVILGPFVMTLPMWLMDLGIVAKPWFNPPYVGVFLEGFLTNGDYMSIVANAIQMVLTILVWYPFVKMYEKRYEVKEDNKEAVISAEDAALLDDLDLDF